MPKQKMILFKRPPAPWMNDQYVKEYQNKTKEARKTAHQTNDTEDWRVFRELRNMLKKNIRREKSTFYRKSLSSKNPKEVWKIINSILKPPARCIDKHPDDLNDYFTTSAE